MAFTDIDLLICVDKILTCSSKLVFQFKSMKSVRLGKGYMPGSLV